MIELIENLDSVHVCLIVALIISLVYCYNSRKEKDDLQVRFNDQYLEKETIKKEKIALDMEYRQLKSEYARHMENQNTFLSSRAESMPWLAGMMADYLTYDLEVEAKKLDWGHNVQREKKVASIREIRAEAKSRIEPGQGCTVSARIFEADFSFH